MSAGVVVTLRVTPRASRDAVGDVDDEGALRVRVTAAPADGAANKAVLGLMARTLHVPRSALSIVSGASSRHKRLRIEGVERATLLARWPGVAVGGG